MKVLILGATGHIGRRLFSTLSVHPLITPIAASRHPIKGDFNSFHISIDIRNKATMIESLKDIDCVVNCVTGDAESISAGANVLINAALSSGCSKIVHLSTMSVYGGFEGFANENTSLDPSLGWYAKAKCEAEQYMAEFCLKGGSAVVLRPGCVYGPKSELWVGRIGRLLRANRLGDIGSQGDGWSNLVHVDDVCSVIINALLMQLIPGESRNFNLVAPDSPRWNQYFIDLALLVKPHPVQRLSTHQLLLDAYFAGPSLKIADKILTKFNFNTSKLPDVISPSFVRFLNQHILLDPQLVTNELNFNPISYKLGLADSASWFLQEYC